MAKENNSLSVFDDFERESAMYSSFTGDDSKSKVILYNAINSPDKKVADFVGKKILIRDFVIEKVVLVNDETGVPTYAPRCVLIDTNSVSYSCVSFGMLSSLKKLSVIFGMPTWEDGVEVEVQNITTGHGKKTMTLKAL